MKTTLTKIATTVELQANRGPRSRTLTTLAAVALLLMVTGIASAQNVNVTATAGTAAASYTTLKGAFDAINAGTHQGAIVCNIALSTSEGATPAVLNSSGAGSAIYTSVLIQPSADGVSISGASPTGRGVIELNGADNVTINGDNPSTGGPIRTSRFRTRLQTPPPSLPLFVSLSQRSLRVATTT